MLAATQFREWVSQSGKTLFCPGIPGAGKTVITAIVVDELQSIFQTRPNVAVAYVYCNYRRQFQQKPVHLLASLLRQLKDISSTMLEQNHRTLRRYTETSSAIKIVTQRLLSVVSSFSRVFIIVDGLDQCQNWYGASNELLTELFYLQDNGRVNLFITSRFIPEIELLLNERSTKLEIRAQNEDLQTYLDKNHSSSLVLQSRDLWKDIKSEIIIASNGM